MTPATQAGVSEAADASAGLCEVSNAHIKTRFVMASLLVRGLTKITCTVLTALTPNLVAHVTRSSPADSNQLDADAASACVDAAIGD
jgi:hypothetical protein